MRSQNFQDVIHEYHVRVQDVLSGMDGIIANLSLRLEKAEAKLARLERRSAAHPETAGDPRIGQLEERIAALSEAVSDLLLEE